MSDVLCVLFIFIKRYMDKNCNLFFFFLSLFLIVSCQTNQVHVSQTDHSVEIQKYISNKLREYQVDQIDIDYMAECKARIKTPARTYNISCGIFITHLQQLRLTVSHTLGGVVVMMYADNKIIQVLDRSEKKFYQVENNQGNRKRVPLLTSLSIIELQSIFWGRETTSTGNNLNFQMKNKRPYQARKIKKNQDIVVHFKKWFQSRNTWFPKVIEIEDIGQKISIKLVITEFSPGFVENLKISRIPEGYSKTL